MDYENYSDDIDDSYNPLDEYPAPQPLPVATLTLPTLDLDLIPEEMVAYIKTIGSDIQASIDAIVVSTIQAISVVIGTKVRIFSKQYKSWNEAAPIWSMVASRSGTRKSNIHYAVRGLLSGITKKYQLENDAIEMKYETQVDSLNNQISALQIQLKKTPTDSTLTDTLTATQAQLRQLTKDRYPVKRLMTDDATIEKVQEMCVDNKNGVGVSRDELSGVFASMTKQNHQSDRDFYLAAYNCTSPYTIDRIIRGTRHIERLCVSLSGFIQPSVLTGFLTEMFARNHYDGFFSRFLLTVFVERVKYDGRNIPLNELAIAEMKANVEFLEQWTPESDINAPLYRKLTLDLEDILGVKFGSSAQKTFDVFDQQFEDSIYEMDALESDDPVYQAMLEHKSKYKTLVLKLCLIFHLIKHAGSGVIPPLVDEITLARALAWTEYLEPHAAKMYQPTKVEDKKVVQAIQNVDTVTPVAIAILKKIAVRSIKDGMTAANIKSGGWAGIKDKALIEQALEKLAHYHWIDYSEQGSGNSGGINSKKVTVNPKAQLLLGDEKNYTQLTNQYNQNQYYHQDLKRKLASIKNGQSYLKVETGELMPKL